MTTTHDIVIAGAGIGGLTAALALHARGMRPLILESTAELAPLGVGINLQPAAVEAMEELGLRDRLEEIGLPTSQARYVTQTGVELGRREFDHDEQQISIHRGELQMMLYDAVRDRLGDDAVVLGRAVTGFEATTGEDGSGRVLVHVDIMTKDCGHEPQGQETYEARVLLAADGIHSAIREQLHPGTGYQGEGTTMFRGTTRRGRFLDGRTMVLIYGEESRRFLAYPISGEVDREGDSLVNWVAMVPTDDGGPLTRKDMANVPTDPAEVAPYFDGWSYEGVDLAELAKAAADVLRYPLADRPTLDTWGEGRVTLLGDAGHAMYPIGANGGSQAILDGMALARALDGVDLAADDAAEAALRSYEDDRRPATTEIVETNRKLNEIERALAGRSQEELAELGESGKFDEIQKHYAHGEFDDIDPDSP